MSLRSLLLTALIAAPGCADDTARTPDLTPAALCPLPATSEIELPADDARHKVLTEWFYWTGHLQADDGRWFGFQVTFLIIGPPGVSAVVAHLALTDVAGQRYEQAVRIGAEPDPPVVDGFRFELSGAFGEGSGGTDALRFEVDGTALDLAIQDVKGPVLRHETGYRDYGLGIHTWYYARPRMAVSGTLTSDGVASPVTGTAWFDHQWGRLGAPDGEEARWDWIGAQLDDGREIMVVVLPDGDGGLAASAEITERDCTTREHFDGVSVTSIGQWTNPATGCDYPMGWRLEVDGQTFDIAPAYTGQEFVSDTGSYWEGAATITGDVAGRAYVEMVGYCGR